MEKDRAIAVLKVLRGEISAALRAARRLPPLTVGKAGEVSHREEQITAIDMAITCLSAGNVIPLPHIDPAQMGGA